MCLGKYQVKFGKCLGKVKKNWGKVQVMSFTFSNKKCYSKFMLKENKNENRSNLCKIFK